MLGNICRRGQTHRARTHLGISQSTGSHHVRKLADAGFVPLHKEGTATRVSVGTACCTGLPHAAEAVMGMLARPCCPTNLPDDVTVRSLEPGDWPAVRRTYAEGIDTGYATFETEVPPRKSLEAKWLPDHSWAAEIDGEVAGWAAVTPVSNRQCYAGVAETSVYVGDGFCRLGIGKALLHKQVTAADTDGLWTLQTSIFPETAPASPCTTPPDTAPSASANASPSTTASGATPSSSNAAAPATTSDERTVTRVRGGGSVKGSR